MKKTKKRECCGIHAGQDCAPMHKSIMGCIYHPDNKKEKKVKKTKKTIAVGLKGVGKTERNASIMLSKAIRKQKPLKTYVITMMVKYPKVGIVVPKPTGFKKKLLSGEKKHTIRQNYKFWKKRIDEINAGKAVLSIRQWTGLPYRSEQKEIKVFGKGEVGYERIIMFDNAQEIAINTGTEKGYVYLSDKRILTVIKNDGVPVDIFRKFFKDGLLDGIIIHFTKLRYVK